MRQHGLESLAVVSHIVLLGGGDDGLLCDDLVGVAIEGHLGGKLGPQHEAEGDGQNEGHQGIHEVPNHDDFSFTHIFSEVSLSECLCKNPGILAKSFFMATTVIYIL